MISGRKRFGMAMTALALSLAVKQADECERPGATPKRGKGQRKKNKANRWR